MKHILILKNNKECNEFVQGLGNILDDVDHEVIFSSSMEESLHYIESLPEPSRIYIAGGDGTIGNLLSPFINSKHELVVLPLGTGNDFSRVVNGKADSVEIVRNAINQKASVIDAIQVNDRYFINATCFGLDSTVANHVHDASQSWVPKKLQYITSILKRLMEYNGYYLKMSMDGQVAYEGKIVIGAICNANYYGGGFPICPLASVNDGIMNIILVDYLPLYKVPYAFYQLFTKKLASRKETHIFEAKEIDIEASNEGNVDGDTYQSESYHFQVLPQSIRVVFTYKSGLLL